MEPLRTKTPFLLFYKLSLNEVVLSVQFLDIQIAQKLYEFGTFLVVAY